MSHPARKPLMLLALALLLAGVWWMLRETEEDRLADWVRQVAEGLPARETAAFMDLVGLERFGFRLERYAIHDRFASDDRERFLRIVESSRPMLVGSEISLRRVKAEIDGELARVDAVAHWKRGRSPAPGPNQARVRVEARLVRQGEGWVFSSLRIAPLLSHPQTGH